MYFSLIYIYKYDVFDVLKIAAVFPPVHLQPLKNTYILKHRKSNLSPWTSFLALGWFHKLS